MAKKLSKKQHEKDSMVFGAIMAGAMTTKKALRPHNAGAERITSMCALGAGNRGRKVTQASDILKINMLPDETLHELIPLIRFAVANDVSENYACGVNDGFEDSTDAAKRFYKWADRDSLDYQRGWHVGQSARIELVTNQ